QHGAVVRFSRGVDLIYGVGDGMCCAVEAKRDFGGRQVVINGLRNTHNLNPAAKQVERDLLGTVAANNDDGINAQLADIADDLVGHVLNDFPPVLNHLVLEGIAAIGSAENGAAARQETAHVLEFELAGSLRPDKT